MCRRTSEEDRRLLPGDQIFRVRKGNGCRTEVVPDDQRSTLFGKLSMLVILREYALWYAQREGECSSHDLYLILGALKPDRRLVALDFYSDWSTLVPFLGPGNTLSHLSSLRLEPHRRPHVARRHCQPKGLRVRCRWLRRRWRPPCRAARHGRTQNVAPRGRR